MIGLALDRGNKRDELGTNGMQNGAINGNGEEDDEEGMGPGERERFEAIMGMVAGWPGPG